MSSSTATVAAEATAGPAVKRSSPVWVGFLLLLLFWAWTALARPGTRPAEPLELLAACFEISELPESWHATIAREMRDQSSMVVLTRTLAEPEAPRAEVPKSREQSGDQSGQPRFDWDRLPMGMPGSEPVEIVLVQYPQGRGKREIERMFQGAGAQEDSYTGGPQMGGPDSSHIGDNGGKRVLERGVLYWGDYAAPFALEREYEAGGTFRDFVRVNLSGKNAPKLLVARWARGSPAAKSKLQAWLTKFPPRMTAAYHDPTTPER